MTMTVVVDGGGCGLGAFDSQGNLFVTAANGPASLSLGESDAWLHISRGLTTLASQLGKPASWIPERVCLGLSGALQSARRERFLALLPSTIIPILVKDGHAQLLGATGGESGIYLAIGTGSVLHWLDDSGTIGLAGGWGFPAGDEGSGAWLGLQLINAYLWHRDGRQHGDDVPTLFQAAEPRTGTTVSEVQGWSISARPTEVASLAPMIVSAAVAGDPACSIEANISVSG